MKTGRNDPCPCGSGKKYKRCCLGNEVALPSPPVHEEFHEDFPDLKSALQSRIWASMEEAQDYADRHVRDFNLKPLADFHGLSPDHMRRLIYHPWECPELVEFPAFGRGSASPAISRRAAPTAGTQSQGPSRSPADRASPPAR